MSDRRFTTTANFIFVTLITIVTVVLVMVSAMRQMHENLCESIGYSDRIGWNGKEYCIGIIDDEIKVLPYDVAIELANEALR